MQQEIGNVYNVIGTARVGAASASSRTDETTKVVLVGSRVLKEPIETTLYSLKTDPPKPPDRRTSERYLRLLRVGCLTIGDRRELCLLKNISAGGMMVRAYSQIEPGACVSIELKQGHPVTGVARWSEGELTGITFDEAIDVLGLLCSTTDGQRPRMPRIEVDCTAWVREGAFVRRTRALNVSQGGLCVESRHELTIGAEVVATLPGLSPVPGVVKWKDGDLFGVGFNRVIALSQLVIWLGDQQDKQPAVA